MTNGRPFGGRFAAPAGGRGRMPGGFALGPGGICKCLSCGYTTTHGTGDPCYTKRCPKCGAKIVRG